MLISTSGIQLCPKVFLNQECVAHAWFLEIAFVQKISMHVCVRPQTIKNHSCEMKPEYNNICLC